uniref:L-ornithine N(5)-oxygenase n=1 Tax=Octactis speculum TaxID=3111310 RepID=A0A7S2GGT9_9STRA
MALAAVRSGKWRVTIIEKGDAPAANVRDWDHVRLFSAWELNMSLDGIEVLQGGGKSEGAVLPPSDEFPTGQQYRETYLEPLVEWLSSSGECAIRCAMEVISIGRGRLLKSDMSGRAAVPFRVLMAVAGGDTTADMEEEIMECDAVVDASGTYGNGNWLGEGGVPALGERRLKDSIQRIIPDVLGAERSKYLGKTTVVVGSGYSAITTINQLRLLAAESPTEATSVVWATRRGHSSDVPLYERVENDPLPAREALSALANGIAEGSDVPGLSLRHLPGVQLAAIRKESVSGRLELSFHQGDDTDDNSGGGASVAVVADNVVANVGFRPQLNIFQELQVHQCYASEGPMRLAAALMASSGSGSNDCLQQVAPGPATLVSPEKNFFIAGMKSYGRSSKFLLKIGHEQVGMILGLLNQEGDGATA